MKVYARYYEENGTTYRLSTILQFGDSWDVIGSVVLLNPGSARPIQSNLDEPVLRNISKVIGEAARQEDWRQFNPDGTIANVERLFQGQKFGHKKDLNGVVLLLNLFNRRDPNSGRAVFENGTCASQYSSSIKDELVLLAKYTPVYLGWGRLNDRELVTTARMVFDFVLPQNNYLNPDFSKNCFRHLSPMSYNTVKEFSPAWQYMKDFFESIKFPFN